MLAYCLAPIIKCAYKKAQQQIKEEAFQDGDFLQKVHQYLSSPDVLENTAMRAYAGNSPLGDKSEYVNPYIPTQSPEEDWGDHMQNHHSDSPLYVWPIVWSAD